MIINDDNYMDGNKAMASALLLYYHLLLEGCFSGDETVYIDKALFNGFQYLDVVVSENQRVEIDEVFLREAAIIYLLCDLNDMIVEYDDCFHSCSITKKIIQSFCEGKMNAISETKYIFGLLEKNEVDFDYECFRGLLNEIHEKYVRGRFERLVTASKA